MKNRINIILVLLLICSNSYSQKNKEFLLNGNVEGLVDGTHLSLVLSSGDTVAKTISRGTKFTIRGYVKGDANYYFLKVDSAGKTLISKALWLTNSDLLIEGNINNWKYLTLKGSDAHSDWLQFKELQNKVLQDTTHLTKRLHEMFRSFVKAHSNSLFTPYIIGSDMVDMAGLYDSLTDRVKNSYWGVELKKKIILNDVLKSGKIPDFKITTPEGESISIYKLASQSRYTLIDFWASWCGPCRAAIPDLSKVYNAFRDKGFNIIGVSRDKNEAAWKKALAEDKTPWIHGLDNIDDAGKSIFNLNAIPGYILIDKNGKIIQSTIYSRSIMEEIKSFKDKNLFENLEEIVHSLFKESK